MNDMLPQGGPPSGRTSNSGHEGTDLSLKPMIAFALALIALAVVVHFALGLFMTRFEADAKRAKTQVPPLFTDQQGQFPPPNTPVAPREELARHRDRERAVFTTYGWTDRDKGLARVPIDRALEILAERGLPKVKNIAPKGARGSETP